MPRSNSTAWRRLGSYNALWYPVHPVPAEPAASGGSGPALLAAPMGLLAGLALRGRRARP